LEDGFLKIKDFPIEVGPKATLIVFVLNYILKALLLGYFHICTNGTPEQTRI
jgi:hypothetical protein